MSDRLSDDQICALMGITAKEPEEAYEAVMTPLRALVDFGIAKGRAEVVAFTKISCPHFLGGEVWQSPCPACWQDQLKAWGLGDKAG